MYSSVFSNEINLFMEQREASFSTYTIKSDCSVLTEFDRYLFSNNWNERYLSEGIVNGWISSLSGKKTTIQFKVGVIQVFFKFLNGLGIKTYMPPTPIAGDNYVPYIFTMDEVETIFNAADNIAYNHQNPCQNIQAEFPMVLRILYGCGLRIGETLLLKVNDVDFDNGVLTIKNAKGKKQRFVPMDRYLCSLLELYCSHMGLVSKPDSFLFPYKTESDHLPIDTVYGIFFRLLKKLGIQTDDRKWHERGPCLHSFRHTFTVESFRKAKQAGRDINDSVPFLSTYLGHNSLRETDKYLKFSAEMFKDDIHRFSDFSKNIYREVPHEEE